MNKTIKSKEAKLKRELALIEKEKDKKKDLAEKKQSQTLKSQWMKRVGEFYAIRNLYLCRDFNIDYRDVKGTYEPFIEILNKVELGKYKSKFHIRVIVIIDDKNLIIKDSYVDWNCKEMLKEIKQREAFPFPTSVEMLDENNETYKKFWEWIGKWDNVEKFKSNTFILHRVDKKIISERVKKILKGIVD